MVFTDILKLQRFLAVKKLIYLIKTFPNLFVIEPLISRNPLSILQDSLGKMFIGNHLCFLEEQFYHESNVCDLKCSIVY